MSAPDLTPHDAAAALQIIAERMQIRVDQMLERDGSEQAATEGRGAAISYLFASEIVAICRNAAAALKATSGRLL